MCPNFILFIYSLCLLCFRVCQWGSSGLTLSGFRQDKKSKVETSVWRHIHKNEVQQELKTRLELLDCVAMSCSWSSEAVISHWCGRTGVNQAERTHVDMKAQTFSFHLAFKCTFQIVWQHLWNSVWRGVSTVPTLRRKKTQPALSSTGVTFFFRSNSFHRMNTSGNRHFITAAVMAGNTFLYLK